MAVSCGTSAQWGKARTLVGDARMNLPRLPCPACGACDRHVADLHGITTSRDSHGCLFETRKMQAQRTACGHKWAIERRYGEPDTSVIGFVCTWAYPVTGRSFQEWDDGTCPEDALGLGPGPSD